MMEVSHQEGIAVLTLAHGRANAMDTAFCRALTAQLDRLADGPEPALVITATGRIFSAGVDLTQLVGGGADYIAEFLPAFKAMCLAAWQFPKPLVAAVNGHAIAGGCILACAADHRLMTAEGGRIGLPELRVGVPFPPEPMEIVASRMRPEHVAELLLGGESLAPQRALEVGLVDRLVAAEDLLPAALEKARDLARIAPPLYALTKAMLQRPVLERIEAQTSVFGDEVDTIWADSATLNAISEYIARTITRR